MLHIDLCGPVFLGQIVEKEIELFHSLPKEKREIHQRNSVSFDSLNPYLNIFKSSGITTTTKHLGIIRKGKDLKLYKGMLSNMSGSLEISESL